MNIAEKLSSDLAGRIEFASALSTEERERINELSARADQGDDDAGLAAFLMYVQHLTDASKTAVFEALTTLTREGKEGEGIAY